MDLQEIRWEIVGRINPLHAELNPICHLLALLGAHHIFHVSGLRVHMDRDTGKWPALIKKCNFGFYKIRSISELAAKPLATQVEDCCMELVLNNEDMKVWTEWIGA
jgi:hypothetical protein